MGKWFWIVGVFVLCVMISFTSDGDAEEMTSNPETRRKPAAEHVEPKHSVPICSGEYGPKIKGLRLGMEYDAVDEIVTRLCNQRNSEDPKLPVHVDYSSKNRIVITNGTRSGGDDCLFIFENGGLILYSLSGGVFKSAFGVRPESVSDDQLLQIFLDSYGIPSATRRVFTFYDVFVNGNVVETLGYYDGSKTGGYHFLFSGSRGAGKARSNDLIQNWSFTVGRYEGVDYGLPQQISKSDMSMYERGTGPVIKGCRLGMTRADVVSVTEKLFPGAQLVEGENRLVIEGCSDHCYLSFGIRNEVVDSISIGGDALRSLFNVFPHYQELSDFVQGAIDNYGIPRVEKKSKSSSATITTCYECTIHNFQFWIEEIRRGKTTSWCIGCKTTDTSKFD